MNINNAVSGTQAGQAAAPRIHRDRHENTERWVTGNLSDYVQRDYVEISSIGRELGAGAIQHMAAKYYGTADINASLEQVLSGKDQKVSNAVYSVIQSNMIVDGSLDDAAERDVLIDLGLAQAKFIAAQYMNDEEAETFMAAMNKIAAIALTRTVDPETGQASYVTPIQKPIGAPDDYVNISELMKLVDPEAYKKYIDEIGAGNHGLDEFIKFAKKVPSHPEWIEKYKEYNVEVLDYLQNLKRENRFEQADYSSMDVFQESVLQMLGDAALSNVELYANNMQYFASLLAD
ncbi:hypothetical protein QNH46_08685 [Paenibacillus woosongensis]|uniref:Uncharacterized protein n=1 Tax=Paenibacillus woosongensis TaxID=307580 RepID=A0AA95ICM7_9BACL|nr:hypothetical protein [Paenibacillus woosongensis]WHX50702.1 hypothetical protein QNH46_08685 [Paenibacillus woosongensis]